MPMSPFSGRWVCFCSRSGLYPTDDLEAAKCDAIMDCTVDLVYKVIPILSGKDEAKKVIRSIEKEY